MKTHINWQEILGACIANVKTHIKPLVKPSGAPQPDLGMGAGGDKMKLVDLAAEKAIVETLLENDISFTLVSEESGIGQFGAEPAGCFVTVDPIDGTTNFVRGLPFYCTSIAISDKPTSSAVFVGCVADLFHDKTYMAFEGRDAFHDGQKIKPSSRETLDEAVIGLDLNTCRIKSIAPQVSALIQETKHVRHFGANALELCYVAEGLTDAFVDVRDKLRATDVAAAFFILKEAGATVTSPDGKPIDLRLDPQQTVRFVASGNSKIHDRILNLIKP